MNKSFTYFISVLILFLHVRVHAQRCEKCVERGVNESNGNIYLYSIPHQNISFVKIITSKATKYYMSVENSGHSVTSALEGLTLTFEDGYIIDKPDNPVIVERDVEHTFGKNKFQFSTYFLLTSDEIDKISNVGIAQYNLYKYEYSLSKSDQGTIKKQVSCLLTAN